MTDRVFESLLALAEVVHQTNPVAYPSAPLQSVQAHPRHSEFLEAARVDPALGKLFPDIDEQFGRARLYRPTFLAWQLVNAASWKCWLNGSADPETYSHELSVVLATMRQACIDESVTMVAVTALSIGLPPDTRLETPYGTLQSITARHRRVVSQLSQEIRIPDNISILETPVKVNLDIRPNGKFARDKLPDPHDIGAHHIALAALLTAGSESFRPTVDVISTRLSPIAPGVPGGGWRTNLIDGPSIPQEQLDEFQAWIARVAAVKVPDITLERVLAIAVNNTEHVYAFIDSVIVWENLFGSGDTQELSFRIALNMALVLSDDPPEREKLFKEIKRLYTKRSQIVHGGLQIRPSDALELRRRTWAITLAALVRMLTNYADLMGGGNEAFVRFALGIRNAHPSDDAA
jgi:hypothetical protein